MSAAVDVVGLIERLRNTRWPEGDKQAAADALEAATAREAELVAQVEALTVLFINYGKHSHNCLLGIRMGLECTCGYNEARTLLEGE